MTPEDRKSWAEACKLALGSEEMNDGTAEAADGRRIIQKFIDELENGGDGFKKAANHD